MNQKDNEKDLLPKENDKEENQNSLIENNKSELKDSGDPQIENDDLENLDAELNDNLLKVDEDSDSDEYREDSGEDFDNHEAKEELIDQSIFEPSQDFIETIETEEELRDIYRNLIEGALYASGEALTVEIISTKLEIPKKEVEELLNELIDMYNSRSTALNIVKHGDNYSLQIKAKYSEKVSQFAEGGGMPEKYLRTLSIIAVKQPILKSTLVKIRGSGAYEHVKFLEENGYIDSVKKGRTSELTVTDLFFEKFNLPKDPRQFEEAVKSELGIE